MSSFDQEENQQNLLCKEGSDNPLDQNKLGINISTHCYISQFIVAGMLLVLHITSPSADVAGDKTSVSTETTVFRVPEEGTGFLS